MLEIVTPEKITLGMDVVLKGRVVNLNYSKGDPRNSFVIVQLAGGQGVHVHPDLVQQVIEVTEDEVEVSEEQTPPADDLDGLDLTEEQLDALREAGFRDVQALKDVSDEELLEIEDLDESDVEDIRSALEDLDGED